MRLGAHQSVAGGAWNAVARGQADGCEALQIFARPSAQWRTRPFAPDEVSLFRGELAALGWPTMSHGSYLINPRATDASVLERSRDALTEELTRAEELGLDYVVIHPGAHLGCGEEGGVGAVAATLTEVHRRVPGLRVTRRLELTAGQGSCLGCRFEHLAGILDGTRGNARVGVCFDTCHAHAAGFDLLNAAGRAQPGEAARAAGRGPTGRGAPGAGPRGQGERRAAFASRQAGQVTRRAATSARTGTKPPGRRSTRGPA